MNLIQNFFAVRVNGAKHPVLHVHGTVMIYTPNPEIYLTKSDPQGVNPNILLLDLTIKEKIGGMKGVLHSACYELGGDEVNKYDAVQIVGKHGSITVDIKSPDLSNLIGNPVRLYTKGEALTKDFIENRVNIEVNNKDENKVVDIWFG